MKSTPLANDSRGFITLGFWGWLAVVLIVLSLLVIYPIRGEIGDTILDFLSIFTDGADLGEFVGGFVVGIITALWNFGTSIGYSLFGGGP